MSLLHQGAWFILESYPLKCDSLALGNAVLQLYGPAAQPAPPALPQWQQFNPAPGIPWMQT